MLDWLKGGRGRGTPATDPRELLFGDVPLERWGATGDGEPWVSFRAATKAMSLKDQQGAKQALSEVLAQPGLESRHYLEAWTALNALGIAPDASSAKHVYGVVLDVPVGGGRDTLAAYEDGSARYLNYSGKAIVWDASGTDREVDARAGALLDAGRALATAIGRWTKARPPLALGTARISLLTSSGLHFGEGPVGTLSSDPLAAPTFEAGAALMQALMSRAALGPGASTA